MTEQKDTLSYLTDIISAHVSHKQMSPQEFQSFIRMTHRTLSDLKEMDAIRKSYESKGAWEKFSSVTSLPHPGTVTKVDCAEKEKQDQIRDALDAIEADPVKKWVFSDGSVAVSSEDENKWDLNPAPGTYIPREKPSLQDTDNYLTCRECGEKFVTLRRHLKETHDMSKETYIKKHNLPINYSMTCKTYSNQISESMKKWHADMRVKPLAEGTGLVPQIFNMKTKEIIKKIQNKAMERS